MTRTVVVNDRMQKGYVYYRTEPVGRNFAPGFARMVSVVLPVFHGPEDARRCEADSAVASHRAARRGHPEALREERRRLPAPAAAGGAALSV